MQNLESVAHKMAELPLDASETPLLTPLIKKNLIIVMTVHTNFHAKSGNCSSKNGRVIA